MYLSLLLILVSFFLLKGILQSDSKLKKYVILITFYLNYFLLTVYVLFNFLSGDGINDAIIFHVKFGINGFGVNEYIIPSMIFIFFNLIAFSSSRIFLRNLTDQKTKLITNRTLSLTILVLSIIFNPFYKDIYELLSDRSNNYQVDKNSFYEQDIIFSDTRKNIVFIYLEQIERTYLNEDLFPNLLPNLKTLEKQKTFGVKEAQDLLSSVTAPWIQDLDLQIISISELKCKFILNYSEKLVRAGNIICGQAIVSAADTAMIVAVISAIGKYQEITTVDISCKYLRPLLRGGGSIETEILKLGQRLVVGRITIKDIQSNKAAAEISCTYARL